MANSRLQIPIPPAREAAMAVEESWKQGNVETKTVKPESGLSGINCTPQVCFRAAQYQIPTCNHNTTETICVENELISPLKSVLKISWNCRYCYGM